MTSPGFAVNGVMCSSTTSRCSGVSAVLGNDVATLPDFPAEIRAPAGSLPGVSGFQLHFADHDILTLGDAPDVLVAMNPAALKTNVDDLEPGATIIVNSDAFSAGNPRQARPDSNPLDDASLSSFNVVRGPLSTPAVGALRDTGDLDATALHGDEVDGAPALGELAELGGLET